MPGKPSTTESAPPPDLGIDTHASSDAYVAPPSEATSPSIVSEPEWVDGEEVYAIYRPDRDSGDDHAA
jgi:hypothetical protein